MRYWNVNESKKGYWLYSIIAVIIGMSLFGFLGYLLYDLILKLSEKDLSNNTIIQALITLIITVFLGGYFSKWLERKNAKKLEIFKIQREISIRVIDYATTLYYHPDALRDKELLKAESVKIKIFFDDKTLKSVNQYIEAIEQNCAIDDMRAIYDNLATQLKKAIR